MGGTAIPAQILRPRLQALRQHARKLPHFECEPLRDIKLTTCLLIVTLFATLGSSLNVARLFAAATVLLCALIAQTAWRTDRTSPRGHASARPEYAGRAIALW